MTTILFLLIFLINYKIQADAYKFLTKKILLLFFSPSILEVPMSHLKESVFYKKS